MTYLTIRLLALMGLARNVALPGSHLTILADTAVVTRVPQDHAVAD